MVLDSGRYQISLLHQPVEADFCNQETKQQPQRYRRNRQKNALTKDQLLHLLSGCTQRLDFSVLLNLLGDPDLEDIINDHNGKQHDSEDQGSTNHNHFIARLQYPLQVEVIDDHVFLVNAAGIRDFFYNRRNIIHRYICRITQGKIDIILPFTFRNTLILKILRTEYNIGSLDGIFIPVI